jgi:hypothetical protein
MRCFLFAKMLLASPARLNIPSLTAALLTSAAGFASHAHANYVCVNGPITSCVWMGGNQGGGKSKQDEPPGAVRGPLPKISTHVAVVLHPDADDPWAIWNTPHENAKERALAACEAAMQDKRCYLAAAGVNSTVVVGYLNNHLMDAAWGETPERAKRNLKEKCGEGENRCLVGAVFTAKHDIHLAGFDINTATYFPTRQTVRLKRQNALRPQPSR